MARDALPRDLESAGDVVELSDPPWSCNAARMPRRTSLANALNTRSRVSASATSAKVGGWIRPTLNSGTLRTFATLETLNDHA